MSCIRGLTGEEAVYVDGRVAGKDVFGTCKDVVDIGRRDDAERDLAVDAAEGKVIDLVAEGWNVSALGGVKLDGENIFPVGAKMLREFERERREAAFVFAKSDDH